MMMRYILTYDLLKKLITFFIEFWFWSMFGGSVEQVSTSGHDQQLFCTQFLFSTMKWSKMYMNDWTNIVSTKCLDFTKILLILRHMRLLLTTIDIDRIDWDISKSALLEDPMTLTYWEGTIYPVYWRFRQDFMRCGKMWSPIWNSGVLMYLHRVRMEKHLSPTKYLLVKFLSYLI